MVLVAQLPDLHIYERRDFEDRLDALDQMIDLGVARCVDLWLLPGDLYHTRSTPRERLELMARIARMAEHAPVIIVRGNHDHPGEILIFNWLRTTHPIYAHEEPGIVELPGCNILTIPHVDKGQDVAGLPETSLRERALTMLEGAKEAIEDLPAAHRPVIVVTHLGVQEGKLTGAETMPMHAADVTLAELLSTGADYTALGHFHEPQKLPGGKAAYGGSGTPNDWGDEGRGKGFWFVSLGKRGDLPTLEFQPIVSRRWVTITCIYAEGEWQLEGPDPESLTDQDVVRVRIEAPADKVAEIDEVRAQAQEALGHVYRLEWDVQRERAFLEADEKIAEAESLADMLQVFWEAGETPAPEFQAACLAALRKHEAALPV